MIEKRNINVIIVEPSDLLKLPEAGKGEAIQMLLLPEGHDNNENLKLIRMACIPCLSAANGIIAYYKEGGVYSGYRSDKYRKIDWGKLDFTVFQRKATRYVLASLIGAAVLPALF